MSMISQLLTLFTASIRGPVYPGPFEKKPPTMAQIPAERPSIISRFIPGVRDENPPLTFKVGRRTVKSLSKLRHIYLPSASSRQVPPLDRISRNRAGKSFYRPNRYFLQRKPLSSREWVITTTCHLVHHRIITLDTSVNSVLIYSSPYRRLRYRSRLQRPDRRPVADLY